MVLCWMGGDHVFAVHQWLYAVQKKKVFYLDQTNVTEHKTIFNYFQNKTQKRLIRFSPEHPWMTGR